MVSSFQLKKTVMMRLRIQTMNQMQKRKTMMLKIILNLMIMMMEGRIAMEP